MAIEAKELQTEVKGFLRDTNAKYLDTLELIYTYFRVQTTGEHLRDTTIRSDSTSIVQRRKIYDGVLLNKTDAPAKTSVPFPNNHGRLFTSKYYLQFREWYSVLLMMKSERTHEQMA